MEPETLQEIMRFPMKFPTKNALPGFDILLPPRSCFGK